VLTLVSDDNFSPLQRTLLLQFTLGRLEKQAPLGAPVRLSRASPLAFLAICALELERLGDRSVVLGLHQEGVQPAAVIDGLQRIGRHPQLERTAERVRDQRDVQTGSAGNAAWS
jgi:hypothetical protein